MATGFSTIISGTIEDGSVDGISTKIGDGIAYFSVPFAGKITRIWFQIRTSPGADGTLVANSFIGLEGGAAGTIVTVPASTPDDTTILIEGNLMSPAQTGIIPGSSFFIASFGNGFAAAPINFQCELSPA